MLFGRYASRASEAKYPSLWRGLVGSWAPSITGPTGTRLFDLSGRNNHGTLTNMDPAGDWIRSQGRYALDFDGTNDSISTNKISGISGASCVSAWIYPRAVASYQIIAAEDLVTSSFRNWIFGYGVTSNCLVAVDFTSSGFTICESGAHLVANKWQHVVWNRAASGMSFWIDGNQSGSTFAFSGLLETSVSPTALGIRAATGFEQFANMQFASCEIFSRALSPTEIRLLATRPGIAYELAPRRWSAATIDAYRRRTQYQQLVGGGII